ncbi:hypothetical protein TNCV_3460681 [Trichonephila clavipes]|nr:hypothetical protein TNCV_3460681 [Trichonephila clavipes]
MVIRSEGAVEYVMVGVSRRPTQAIWRGKEIEPVQKKYLLRILPRKRKPNLSQSSNKARAMTIARLSETFPQAELRRLEQSEHEAAHRVVEICKKHFFV